MILPAAQAPPTRWLGFIAVFLFALTPLVAYLSPLGFAPLLALGGLMAIPDLRRVRAQAWPVLILLLLALWAVVSLSWSPAAPDLSRMKGYDDLEGVTALKLVLQVTLYGAVVVALRGLSTPAALRADRVMTAGLLALAAFVLIDTLLGAAIFQKVRALTGDPIRVDFARIKISLPTYVQALLFWPVALILARRGGLLARGAIVALLACTAFCAWRLDADAPLAALVVGGVAWALVWRFGAAGAWILPPVIAAPFVLAPLVVLLGVETGLFAVLHRSLPQSWDARLDIWAYVADHIQTHPLRGWGMDASRAFGPAIPLHPHNAPLQLWLELGAVGVALATAFLCWIAYAIVRMAEEARGEAAMAAGVLATYLTIGALSFGVWQEWWLALGALAFIACNLARRAPVGFAKFGDKNSLNL
ncbi:MAG: O-antigen polymerase [Caulobacter sp.]|nr:O-antigen polymerase [Caulobacter sp.]